ncbi:MAG: c-type cytochrome [Desulfobacteraceae bacterium]|jgi:mono/diheme cytochrome c family protein
MKRILVIALVVVALALVAYEALTFIDNEFMPGRMRETPAVRPYEKPLLIMEQGVIPFEGGEAVYKAADGKRLKSPFLRGDANTAKRGETLYFTYCAQCHGKFHDGNGTVGQSFHPLPTDLRSVKVQTLPEGVLFKEISYGVPSGRQPPLATTIEVMDRWRIVAYVKSLGVRR